MPASLPGFVLGYHGCSREVAELVLGGTEALQFSQNDYDWLGHGIYFWENDPRRAWEWAQQHRRIENPAVIGSIIDCGLCLNLLESSGLSLVKTAYDWLMARDEALPENEAGFPGDMDFVKRYLDCIVVEAVHTLMSDEVSFNTVRAMFPEKAPLYEGAGFRSQNHIQICVRDPGMILGYFRPINPKTQKPFDWA